MKISIIIPCYNAANTIEDQLQALINQALPYPYEIIVVNNNSTDHSREIVCHFHDRYPHIQLIEATAKKGPGYARNVGAQAANGEILVFCDADDVVGEDWLKKIVDGTQEAEIAIGRIEFKRLNKNSWLKYFDIDSDYYEDEDVEEEDHRASFPPYLMMIRGWGFAIKKEYFAKAGGFDESLMAAEDLDFGFKAQLAGARVKFIPNAVLHYRLRPTVEGMKQQWYNYGKFTALLKGRYNQNIPLRSYLINWTKHLSGWIKLFVWRVRISERWEMGLYTRNRAFRTGILIGSIKYRVPPID